MTAARPVLYWIHGSITGVQVMMALHERQVAFEGRRLRASDELMSLRIPDFLSLKNQSQEPVWVEPSGRAIRESMAIMLYVDRRWPGPKLLPEDPPRLARVLERSLQARELRAAARPWASDQGDLDSPLAAPGPASGALRQALERWEAHLGQTEHIADDALTLADCVIYPILAEQRRRGLSLEGLPGLSAYMDRLDRRESARRARVEGQGQASDAKPDRVA